MRPPPPGLSSNQLKYMRQAAAQSADQFVKPVLQGQPVSVA